MVAELAAAVAALSTVPCDVRRSAEWLATVRRFENADEDGGDSDEPVGGARRALDARMANVRRRLRRLAQSRAAQRQWESTAEGNPQHAHGSGDDVGSSRVGGRLLDARDARDGHTRVRRAATPRCHSLCHCRRPRRVLSTLRADVVRCPGTGHTLWKLTKRDLADLGGVEGVVGKEAAGRRALWKSAQQQLSAPEMKLLRELQSERARLEHAFVAAVERRPVRAGVRRAAGLRGARQGGAAGGRRWGVVTLGSDQLVARQSRRCAHRFASPLLVACDLQAHKTWMELPLMRMQEQLRAETQRVMAPLLEAHVVDTFPVQVCPASRAWLMVVPPPLRPACARSPVCPAPPRLGPCRALAAAHAWILLVRFRHRFRRLAPGAVREAARARHRGGVGVQACACAPRTLRRARPRDQPLAQRRGAA